MDGKPFFKKKSPILLNFQLVPTFSLSTILLEFDEDGRHQEESDQDVQLVRRKKLYLVDNAPDLLKFK